MIEQLEKELAAARKNSSTSSKPPSSDIVKPPRPAPASGKRRKRRRGGQPGHPKHTRPVFPPEQVDHTWVYEWPESELGPEWEPLDDFRVVQQVDLVEKLFEVPPEAFSPRPRVQSALVRLAPHEQSPWPGCDLVRLRVSDVASGGAGGGFGEADARRPAPGCERL